MEGNRLEPDIRNDMVQKENVIGPDAIKADKQRVGNQKILGTQNIYGYQKAPGNQRFKRIQRPLVYKRLGAIRSLRSKITMGTKRLLRFKGSRKSKGPWGNKDMGTKISAGNKE